MGLDIIPATVGNNTDPGSGVWILAVDGDIRDSQWPPKPGDFYWIRPGSRSKEVIRSVDAFGAYDDNNNPLIIAFNGKTSSWWKIPDGMDCQVWQSEDTGGLNLEIIGSWFGSPQPTTAAEWNYKGS